MRRRKRAMESFTKLVPIIAIKLKTRRDDLIAITFLAGTASFGSARPSRASDVHVASAPIAQI
jgi:hypothetical protein